MKKQNIPTVTTHAILRGDVQDLQFAVLDPANNYHDTLEMAEIYSATHGTQLDRPVVDLVAFKPARVLNQEIIINVSLNIRMSALGNSAGGLIACVDKVKESLANESPKFIAESEQYRADIIAKMRNLDRVQDPVEKLMLKEMLAQVKIHEDYVPGKFIASMNVEEMRLMIVVDRMVNNKIREEAQKLIKQKLTALIAQKELMPLTSRSCDERRNLAVTGGIASGKGSSEAILRYNYEAITRRSWQDIIKVNGDSYKFALNNSLLPRRKYNESGEKEKQQIRFFSQATQDEASLISIAIIKRLNEKLATGSAPDIFIDKVMLPDDCISAATYGGGQLFCIAVTTPVEIAITRSLERGAETGRFERIEGILSTHQASPMHLLEISAKYKGKDMYYHIYDNNVKFGEQPRQVASIDFKSKKVVIFDEKLLAEFVKKVNINVKNSTVDDTIYNTPPFTVQNFLSDLQKKGYSLVFEENKSQRVTKDDSFVAQLKQEKSTKPVAKDDQWIR